MTEEIEGAARATGPRNTHSWEGRELVDRLGHRVGRIETLHNDERTGRPMWAAVQIGLFATKRALVPVNGAHERGDHVQCPSTRTTS